MKRVRAVRCLNQERHYCRTLSKQRKSVQRFQVFESASPDGLEESEDLASQLKEFGPKPIPVVQACGRHHAAAELILAI